MSKNCRFLFSAYELAKPASTDSHSLKSLASCSTLADLGDPESSRTWAAICRSSSDCPSGSALASNSCFFRCLLRSRCLPFGLGGIFSSRGLSAPMKRPREAIPVPHRSRTSYPSHSTPWRVQFSHVGRALSQRRRRRLQVQHP